MWPFHLNKLKSSLPKDAFCYVWLKLAQRFWRRFFKMSMYFHYFVFISPQKKEKSFIWTNLNSLHSRMICAKFGWNWPSGSGGEDTLNLSMYIRNFVIIYPWKRGSPSFEITWIPFTQGYFGPSLIEIVPVVLEKMIFQIY